MTALGTYQRVVIKGTGTSGEIWQTGFWTIAGTPAATQAQLNTDCAAIAAFVNTWWTACKVNCYNSYAITEVDMYQYVAPSTHASLQAQSLLTPTVGTLVTPGSPIDTATVVSIRSGQPGRSGRNRMYVPDMTTINNGTGSRSSTSYNTIGTATKALFTSVAGYNTYVPVVLSRALGQWFQPTSFVTDSKPDVQRRRENKLVAVATQTLPFP